MSRKPSGGRKEFQGRSNARHADQRPPTWPELPGERALRQLEQLWGAPRRPLVRRRT